MSPRENSTIGRLGLAIVAALLVAALWLVPAASASGGGIKGTVTRAVGGAAVLGAKVCALELEWNRPVKLKCTSTSADGTYEISGLPAADYKVRFEMANNGLYLARQFWQGVSVLSEATAITLATEETKSGVDAAMADGGAIAGRVTDAISGFPIEGVEVCSWAEGPEFRDGCAFTASDGSYEILGAVSGPHEVEFLPFNFEPAYEFEFLSGIPVSAGIRTPNVNAALYHEGVADGRISGNVYRAATGQPLDGIAVCVVDEANESRGCAHTGKAGSYEFLQVPVGAWRVAFSPDPSEFESFEPGEITVDAWPSQFWNLKPTLNQADSIGIGHGTVVTGIDALLGPGPPSDPPSTGSPPAGSSSPPAATNPGSVVVTTVEPKPLICDKGFVKKQVKGKARCVKRHQRHHRRHHHRHNPHR